VIALFGDGIDGKVTGDAVESASLHYNGLRFLRAAVFGYWQASLKILSMKTNLFYRQRQWVYI